MAILRLGSRGTEVRRLQLLLNSWLPQGARLRPDGTFGRRTHDAVLLFQKVRRLSEDGVVEGATWSELGLKPAPLPAVVDHGDPPWMAIAIAELGVHENGRAGRHNQRIVEYHAATTLHAVTDEVPWCASFVNWVMRQAGQSSTGSALAKSWLDWGRPLETPRRGAVTVIKRKGQTTDAATGSGTGFHVGFFVAINASSIRILGGNQGDAVRYSSVMLSAYEIRGHRWP